MKAALLFVAVGLFSSNAAAGTIAIGISHTAELREGELRVEVEVGNSGDEPARSVIPMLRFQGHEVRGKIHPTLAPNESLRDSFTVRADALGEGRWPLLFVVEYTDANQYPFQAVLASTLVVGSPPPAKLAVPKFESGGIVDEGKLVMHVKNLAGIQRSVSLDVLLPDALEVTESPAATTLEPWEEKKISVPLANRTALASSNYPVFLVVEYDDGPIHHTLVAQSMVEILAPEERLVRRGLTLWIGAGVIGLVFVAMIAYRLVKR